MKQGLWEVQIKGIEISVLRKNNELDDSLDLFHDTKIRISPNSASSDWHLTEMWNRMILLANEIANKLNQKEFEEKQKNDNREPIYYYERRDIKCQLKLLER